MLESEDPARMEISALHTAILQTVQQIPSVDENHDDDDDGDYDEDSHSFTSSTSFDDVPATMNNNNNPIHLPSIFVESLTRPPATFAPTLAVASHDDFLPRTVAAVSRRDSLEMRYHLEDETKKQLQHFNQTLRQQMNQLQQENERLQRQMVIQNKEHRFTKAQWNDRVLDLQVELDATKLEQLRIKETQDDAKLRQELDDMKGRLITEADEEEEDDEDSIGSSRSSGGAGIADEESTKRQLPTDSTHSTTETTVQSQHFATIPPRSLQEPNGHNTKAVRNGAEVGANKQETLMLQQTIQDLTSAWKQEQNQWESEKSELHILIRKLTDRVEDSRIRVEWLEGELMAICPSGTDDSDNDQEEKKVEDSKVVEDMSRNSRDDSSEVSTASTQKTGRRTESTKRQTSQSSTESSAKVSRSSSSMLGDDPPGQLLEHRLKEAVESYVRIQGQQDRKIQKLTKQLQSLQKEKEMDEGMQYQQKMEMKQKISYYQHKLQQTQKTLQLQAHSRDEFHDEWTRRIEELELENLKVAQQATKWEEQCVHQTGLLKRQVASLQEKLDHHHDHEKESSGTNPITQVNEQENKEGNIIIETKNDSSTECMSRYHLNPKMDAMTLQLAQMKEREATLEKQLADQKEILDSKDAELETARDRIEVLMAYAEMDANDGEEEATEGLI
ncbi:MAG: hypothetical protein SGBAC_007892 [Bacillariaceae sp.]